MAYSKQIKTEIKTITKSRTNSFFCCCCGTHIVLLLEKLGFYLNETKQKLPRNFRSKFARIRITQKQIKTKQGQAMVDGVIRKEEDDEEEEK